MDYDVDFTISPAQDHSYVWPYKNVWLLGLWCTSDQRHRLWCYVKLDLSHNVLHLKATLQLNCLPISHWYHEPRFAF